MSKWLFNKIDRWFAINISKNLRDINRQTTYLSVGIMPKNSFDFKLLELKIEWTKFLYESWREISDNFPR